MPGEKRSMHATLPSSTAAAACNAVTPLGPTGINATSFVSSDLWASMFCNTACNVPGCLLVTARTKTQGPSTPLVHLLVHSLDYYMRI